MPRNHSRNRDIYLLITSIAVVTITAAALWWLFTVFRPIPPGTVVMTTGPEGGAYSEFGKRYREVLAHSGVDLKLIPSAGAIENLRRLRDSRSGVGVGFVQGGTSSEQESPGLVSLGTVFYEPLWFFYRGAPLDRRLTGLRGRRISIGPKDSGTRELMLTLLARNGIDRSFAKLLPLTPQIAAEELVHARIDAAAMVMSWESHTVQKLLADKNVRLLSFPRANAYTALYPYLNRLVFPAGTADMAGNRPPEDVVLLAPEASLVVRKELHPAIQYLLLDAATQIHSAPSIFQKGGEHPTAEATGLPLSVHARNFYKTGRPFLQRYLPFWLAVFFGQLLFLLIPVVGVAYPLLRVMPSMYSWGVHRRIYRLYDELKVIENELDRANGEGSRDLLARIDRLESRANQLRVPASILHMQYSLRRDIHMVRGRIGKG
ncbi:MAG: TAXI family TRAP transporter solute-binding subunit [Candidatus Deferrimicrobiaceae bacterium]